MFGIFLFEQKRSIFYGLYENVKQVEKPALVRIFREALENERGSDHPYLKWTVEVLFFLQLLNYFILESISIHS
jgi:hypothetical protein